MPSVTTLLCFDFGESSIGVAIGQSLTASASPLTAIKAKQGVPDWGDIKNLLDEWRPDRVLVGLPLNMDGSESELCTRSRKFANRIHGRFGIEVEMVDERLSSFEAKGDILQQHHSREFKQQGVDSLAACYILETWFSL